MVRLRLYTVLLPMIQIILPPIPLIIFLFRGVQLSMTRVANLLLYTPVTGEKVHAFIVFSYHRVPRTPTSINPA